MKPREKAAPLHVYGVIDAGAKGLPRVGGRQGAPVRSVRHGKVAVLVSEVDPKARLGREDLLSHAHVLEQIAARHTVVPMRFGVQAGSEEELRESASTFHGHWLELLRRFKGLIQLSIEARHLEKAALLEVLERDPVAIELKKRMPKADDPRGHALRLQLGERIAHGLSRLRVDDRSELLNHLFPVAHSFRNREGDDCVLSASFLVERARQRQFSEAVTRAREAYPRVELRYVGPQPPWAFLDAPSSEEARWAY